MPLSLNSTLQNQITEHTFLAHDNCTLGGKKNCVMSPEKHRALCEELHFYNTMPK